MFASPVWLAKKEHDRKLEEERKAKEREENEMKRQNMASVRNEVAQNAKRDSNEQREAYGV